MTKILRAQVLIFLDFFIFPKMDLKISLRTGKHSTLAPPRKPTESLLDPTFHNLKVYFSGFFFFPKMDFKILIFHVILKICF